MQFYAFRTAYPGVEKFVFHFDSSRDNCQFSYWSGLLHVNPVIDADTRLQVRNVDESGAQILAQALKPSGALLRSARRPGFQAEKDN